MQPIRAAAEVPLEFAVFTHEPFVYQRIGAEARRLRMLGMTLQAIGAALGVDEKTVRKVTRGVASAPHDHVPAPRLSARRKTSTARS